MKRTLIAVLLIACLAVPASFAQLAVGVSGALYSDSEVSFKETWSRFNEGDGIFWGPFVELGMGKLALGLSMNFSMYEEDWSAFYGAPLMMGFVDYDVALYLQAHPFGYKSFLDPFLEIGAGQIGKDYADEKFDPDPDNPLYATNYFEAGVGLGLNLGSLGVFWKMLYMFPGDPAEATTTMEYDFNGDGIVDYSEDMTYYLAAYPLRKLKIFLGGKLIL
ncbi:MAG: hypothetical protein NT080_02700 [Spirochaetes bacterium]|nr:hypothetical protein [Spirochaetota bacterium]